MSRPPLPLLALLLAPMTAGVAAPPEEPLWEVGLGATALSFPDYRGSDNQRAYVLPFPYVVYRGEIFKADRDGVRGIFLDNDFGEINVSVAASLPVDSDGNDARRGMPDLDPTFEIGPSLELHLWRSADRRFRLDLRFPVRQALTMTGDFRNAGLVFTPLINLDISDPFGGEGWNLGMLVGAIYGNQRQNAYFYDVPVEYATPDRPAYSADAGFGGVKFILACSKRFDRYWVGSFLRYDTLSGAVFEDSPLVRQDTAWAAGIGIAWILGKSAATVAVEY